MMASTVLRLRPNRRAIYRTAMPSWWRRKTALRLSASIMELFDAVMKGRGAAQQAGRQQMSLGIKDPALEPWQVLALAHDPLHILLGELQVPQEHALKLAAAIRILG